MGWWTMEELDDDIATVSVKVAEVRASRAKELALTALERERLQRQWLKAVGEWTSKLSEYQKGCGTAKDDLEMYRDALSQVFLEDGTTDTGSNSSYIPPIVATRQAQLCQRIHVMTVMDNQIWNLAQQGQALAAVLEQKAKDIQQQGTIQQSQMRIEIKKLEKDIIYWNTKLSGLDAEEIRRERRAAESAHQKSDLASNICKSTTTKAATTVATANNNDATFVADESGSSYDGDKLFENINLDSREFDHQHQNNNSSFPFRKIAVTSLIPATFPFGKNTFPRRSVPNNECSKSVGSPIMGSLATSFCGGNDDGNNTKNMEFGSKHNKPQGIQQFLQSWKSARAADN